MTKRNSLADSGLRSKNKPPGYYLDGHGLYLQVSRSGSRSWILRYTLNGRTREMGLGSLDDFSLADARDRAQQQRKLIADGIDPIDHRDQQRKVQQVRREADAVRLKTFAQCAEEFHAANADEWRNAKHVAQWINTLKEYAFPKFGKLPVQEVGKSEIVKAVQPIWKTKAETASRVLQRIRTVLNYAAAKDYCDGRDAEFWEQVKLALGSNERARAVEHHSACPYPLVGSVIEMVREGPSTPIVKLAFEFTILTAARSGETRGALWPEADLDANSWIVSKERMKAGREHRVPLSRRAREILVEARALHDAGEVRSDLGLIFANTSGLPFSDMVFTQMMRRLGLPYTMHGFRASFRTWGSELTSYEHEMLEFALAHSVGTQTVRSYLRTEMFEKRRRLMQDWEDYLASQATPVNLSALKKAAAAATKKPMQQASGNPV